jgi:hypothetical protein
LAGASGGTIDGGAHFTLAILDHDVLQPAQADQYATAFIFPASRTIHVTQHDLNALNLIFTSPECKG